MGPGFPRFQGSLALLVGPLTKVPSSHTWADTQTLHPRKPKPCFGLPPMLCSGHSGPLRPLNPARAPLVGGCYIGSGRLPSRCAKGNQLSRYVSIHTDSVDQLGRLSCPARSQQARPPQQPLVITITFYETRTEQFYSFHHHQSISISDAKSRSKRAIDFLDRGAEPAKLSLFPAPATGLVLATTDTNNFDTPDGKNNLDFPTSPLNTKPQTEEKAQDRFRIEFPLLIVVFPWWADSNDDRFFLIAPVVIALGCTPFDQGATHPQSQWGLPNLETFMYASTIATFTCATSDIVCDRIFAETRLSRSAM